MHWDNWKALSWFEDVGKAKRNVDRKDELLIVQIRHFHLRDTLESGIHCFQLVFLPNCFFPSGSEASRSEKERARINRLCAGLNEG